MTNEQLKALWIPSAERIAGTRMHDYQAWLAANKGLTFDDYQSLWMWSVENIESFYESVWDYFDILHSAAYAGILDTHKMPGAKWFQGARLNLAEQLFRHFANEPDRPAIIAGSDARGRSSLSWGELRRQVASVAHGLRRLGVGPGDRVAAYLPNIPETMVAFFATSSIGAIWSVCSPDMGTRSVLDRFGQIEPKVLIAADGYRYGGKDFDRLAVVGTLRGALTSLEHVVLLPYLDPGAMLAGTISWQELVGDRDSQMRFEQVPFDHPLWVVYSSGTSGPPKPIVHGHGGVLLATMVNIALHLDVGPGDRFMWYASTAWVMWNAQMGGLLVGATICLYDGNPGYPDLYTLWRFADEIRMTFLGAGSAYLQVCKKAGIEPGVTLPLRHLKSIGATGSPLPEECYRWIIDQFPDVLIATISGGTDVVAAYVGACPVLPVYAGEMQCRYLGTAVYAMNERGEIVEDEVGELVVTEPMPSMPLYFWNDRDGKRYHASYFDMFPGVWRHGDWIRITPRGGAIIYGRSDTTINRHGIRMGTGEIYRVVEEFPEVVDSLVVDLEYLGRESWMPLFVVLKQGISLNADLVARIKGAIRDGLSPRHVPNEVVAVPEIPRTLSGKKMELPVKKLLLGQPLDKVASLGAMANPESMRFYQAFADQRRDAKG
ncbi:MAG: acetoacetate--CoA ligase [Rhodanobacteraceae bacterium]